MQLLTIRYYQLKRDLGILFFVILGCLFRLSYVAFNHQKQVGYYAIGIIVYFFYSYHQKRNDTSFVLKHFHNPTKQIIIEYQLCLLPISIACLFTNYWYCFILLHALVLSISFIKTKHKLQPKLFFVTRYFKNDFIFISGIRKNYIPLCLFLILAITLSPIKLFGLVALFLFNTIMFSFYDTNESVQLLQSSNVSPKQFLFNIFQSSLQKILVINIPLLAINTLFNYDMLLFNLYFLGYTILLLASAISMKYASYHYHRQLNNNQVKMAMMMLAIFMPELSILAIVFFIQSRQQAIKNLSNYLDDKHS